MPRVPRATSPRLRLQGPEAKAGLTQDPGGLGPRQRSRPCPATPVTRKPLSLGAGQNSERAKASPEGPPRVKPKPRWASLSWSGIVGSPGRVLGPGGPHSARAPHHQAVGNGIGRGVQLTVTVAPGSGPTTGSKSALQTRVVLLCRTSPSRRPAAGCPHPKVKLRFSDAGQPALLGTPQPAHPVGPSARPEWDEPPRPQPPPPAGGTPRGFLLTARVHQTVLQRECADSPQALPGCSHRSPAERCEPKHARGRL